MLLAGEGLGGGRGGVPLTTGGLSPQMSSKRAHCGILGTFWTEKKIEKAILTVF